MLRTENHHYIPQSHLRNFTHTYEGETNEELQLHPGDQVLKAVDLTGPDAKATDSAVERAFGDAKIWDSKPGFSRKQRRDVEKKLKDLESAAGAVFKDIAEAVDKGEHAIQLTIAQDWTMKRFVFAMKYCTVRHSHRYNHDTIDDYSEPDKDEVESYMKEKGLKRPRDVWYDNLVGILDTMVTRDEEDGFRKLVKRIFPLDAERTAGFLLCAYPVLCVPSGGDEEFVATSKSFCLDEGPKDEQAFSDLHTITVVSPKLVFLMRDELLPEVIEDRDNVVRVGKRCKLAKQMLFHVDTSTAQSILQDLPTAKPRVGTYTQGAPGAFNFVARATDATVEETLCFPIHFLDTGLVQSINSIILEEAHKLSEIVFRSESALRLGLEAYLSRPVQGIYAMRTVSREDDDLQLPYLRKLERMASTLGSSVSLEYKVEPAQRIYDLRSATRTAIINYRPEANQSQEQTCADILQVVIRICKETCDTETVEAANQEAKAKYGKSVPMVVEEEVKLTAQSHWLAKRLSSVPTSMWAAEWKTIEKTVNPFLEMNHPIIPSPAGPAENQEPNEGESLIDPQTKPSSKRLKGKARKEAKEGGSAAHN